MASLPKSAAGPKSRPEKQLELLFVLKVQLDLIYKQLNYFEGTCKSVDQLNRKIRNTKLNPDQLFAEFEKFERNYRVLRKRLCKLDKILVTGNPYDKLYDLYESLVIGESIETGENFIDTSAIDSPVVDEVSCSGSVENEDTPVDDLAEIEDTPVDDLSDSDDCSEIQFDPKQHETSNPATSILDSSSVLVADGSKSAPVSNLEFQCDECDKSFNRSYKLRFHKRTHPSESLYRCNFEGCTYGTDRSHLLAKHQTVHTRERPFQCDHCDKCFKLLCHLNVHKIIHESKPRFVCYAEGCDFKSKHPISFKNHSRRVHANDRPFQCNWFECYYKTHLYTSLKCHQKVHLKKFRINLKTHQSVKTELYDELCYFYENLINEDSTAVDEVGSSRSVEIEDTPMDDLSGSEDTPMDDLSGSEDTPMDDLSGSEDTPMDDLAGIEDTPVDDLSGIDDTPVDDLAGIEDTPVDDHAGIVDTPVDDLSGIEDTPVDDLSDSDDCIEILYDSKQLETSNLATSILDSSSVRVAEVGEQSSAPVNSQKFKCHQCDFSTNRFYFLTNHRMSVHLDDRPFRCPICAKSFRHSSNLSGHKRIHQREPRYKCNWEGCNYSCHYTDDLKTHEISDHNGKAPFQCDQCDKSCRLESHLLLHKKGHPIPKLRYRCRYEGCEFRSHQRDTLQLHQINVHRSDQLLKHSFGLSRHHKTEQIQANLDYLKKSSDSIS